MAKLTLNAIGSRYGSIDALNDNSDLIEAALENTLSRDGTGPNNMEANLDMDSHRVINLTDGVNNQDAATVKQVNAIVAAASSGLIASLKERQDATAGQTVFNLSSIEYVPGSNNLSVYINGVRQYPGESYTETDSDTVTFTSGLNLGAEVLFVTNEAVDNANLQASAVHYTPAGTGAVATNVQAKLRQTVSVKDFGAVGDGVVNDRLAIIAAVQYVASIGNGTVFFPAGTYLISGVDGTYSLPEIQSNLQYSNSSIEVQMYFSGLNGVNFVFDGAKLKSDKTDGGVTLCFDECNNIYIESIRMEGATVMSGPTATVTGTNGLSFWSRSQNSTNITLNSPYIDAHYTSIDIAGDPYAATKVSNLTVSGSSWFGNSYYGFACRGNGVHVAVENALSYKQNRAFFIYDTEEVSINIDVDFISNTGLTCLLKAYTYNTRNINIRMCAKNKANVVTPRLLFESQHNPALQPTPAYVRDVYINYSEINCGSGGDGVEFRYYRDATLTATSSDTLFDNFTIVGTSNNNLDSLVTLTNNNRLCSIDISKFFPANNFDLLDGKGFIGSKKFTYSPTILFGGASVGVTYSVNSGNYYVVGGLCFVNGRITLSALGSSTGAAEITLPIKTQTGTSRNPLFNIDFPANVVGITSAVFGEGVVPNSNLVSLRMQGPTGTTPLTHANFTNTSDILFSAVYPI